MRVWLPNASDPVVWPGSNQRPMRTALLSQALIDQGHEVWWFSSTFDHSVKQPRTQISGTETPAPGLHVVWLKSPGYRKNISLARLVDHHQIGRRFSEAVVGMCRPDVILCSLPILELAQESVRYGNRWRVPVVVDIRDWWPDVFYYAIPGPLHWLARLLLRRFHQMARTACAGASAITGITPAFVEWGLRHAERPVGAFDRAFPHAYPMTPPAAGQIENAKQFWAAKDVGPDKGNLIFTFVGSISHTHEVSTILQSARLLRQKLPSARFVLCGNGDRLEEFLHECADLPTVIFPGWVNRAQLYTLLQMSYAGLSPLPHRPDFLATINNKTIEYLSAGLPVISSPKCGTVFDLLNRFNCGLSYDAGDGSALASIMLRLAHDSEFRHRLAANARELYFNQFVAENVFKEMASHLHRLTSSAPSVVQPASCVAAATY